MSFYIWQDIFDFFFNFSCARSLFVVCCLHCLHRKKQPFRGFCLLVFKWGNCERAMMACWFARSRSEPSGFCLCLLCSNEANLLLSAGKTAHHGSERQARSESKSTLGSTPHKNCRAEGGDVGAFALLLGIFVPPSFHVASGQAALYMPVRRLAGASAVHHWRGKRGC